MFNEDTWAAEMNAGAVSGAAKRFTEAQKHFCMAMKEIRGNSALETGAQEFTLCRLGALSEAQGEIGEAENYYRKSFTVAEKMNPKTAYPFDLIEFYQRAGNSPAAKRLQARYQAPYEASQFATYMNSLQVCISRSWAPFHGSYSTPVRLLWRTHPDGSASLIHVDQSSGNAVTDREAFDAVKKAYPFPPLPNGIKYDVDIQFSFTQAHHGL